MRRKKVISWAMGLAIVAMVPVLVTTDSLGANSARLKVFPAPPPVPSVPVSVVNTPSVNSNITNASVPVTGSVAVTGTVGVSSLPPLILTGGGPNSSTNPVFVKDVNSPANEPVQVLLCQSTGPLYPCTAFSNTYAVPSTTPDTSQPVKALAVDYVSGYCSAFPGSDPTNIFITTPSGATPHYFVPVKTYGPNSSNVNSYAFSQETRIYAAPGTTIAFGFSYTTDGIPFGSGNGVSNVCFGTIDGHLVTQ